MGAWSSTTWRSRARSLLSPRNPGLLTEQFDDVPDDELSSAPFLGLTVDADGSLQDEVLGHGAVIGKACELQELTESD